VLTKKFWQNSVFYCQQSCVTKQLSCFQSPHIGHDIQSSSILLFDGFPCTCVEHMHTFYSSVFNTFSFLLFFSLCCHLIPPSLFLPGNFFESSFFAATASLCQSVARQEFFTLCCTLCHRYGWNLMQQPSRCV